jgi:hypothetical protein
VVQPRITDWNGVVKFFYAFDSIFLSNRWQNNCCSGQMSEVLAVLPYGLEERLLLRLHEIAKPSSIAVSIPTSDPLGSALLSIQNGIVSVGIEDCAMMIEHHL